MARRVLVTGGGGFIGSHAAEYFVDKGDAVRVVDNLSRGRLLKKDDPNSRFNWDHLAARGDVDLVLGDIRDETLCEAVTRDVDVIIHAAAQTAVTTSITDPQQDFTSNLVGTFNILEGARRSGREPAIIYCSTNKVYGENVNTIGIRELETRYVFEDAYASGVPETFGTDLCKHTPYGCSKLGGDLYVQEYGRLYGLRTAVFRMSCIYGTRQFGMEDQGWVAWFTIAVQTGKALTIYGDGKQVRDLLWVSDLIRVYDAFLESDLREAVFNVGGGPTHTLSLLELLEILAAETGIVPEPGYSEWRPSDQKVYVSDIRLAQRLLGWSPRVTPAEGVRELARWVERHRACFAA